MDPGEQRLWWAAALVRAVNHPTVVGLRPIVLTCRTSQYAQLTGRPLVEGDDEPGSSAESFSVAVAPSRKSAVVQDVAVVGIEPLNVLDVIAHLRCRFPDSGEPGRDEPRWHPVVDGLAANRECDPVVTAQQSPLRCSSRCSYQSASSQI